MRTACCSRAFLSVELRASDVRVAGWQAACGPSRGLYPATWLSPLFPGAGPLHLASSPPTPTPRGQPGPYLLSATRFLKTSPPTTSLSGFRQICTM